jgi:hypothetical protein
MYKLYLIVFGSDFKAADITAFLDQSPDTEFWSIKSPNSIFVKSVLTAAQLNKLIEKRFNIIGGSTHSIMITEVSATN